MLFGILHYIQSLNRDILFIKILKEKYKATFISGNEM